MSKGKTKLTLSIDSEAVKKGKRYSRKRGQNLSAVIERYLYSLTGDGPRTVADTLVGIVKLKKGETLESIRFKSISRKHLK